MTTTAITYSRVSTAAQSGEDRFSIPQQSQALREYCEGRDWRIVAEVTDPGYSGASLARPGLDQVRDLVAAGGIDVVVAQDRDRFARKVVLNGLLEEELQKHGCKTLALNDYGDDSPEGLLMRGIQGQFAEYERLKITERTRRGKAAKVRGGKILRTKKTPFGFRYHESGEALVVNGAEMEVVERLFRMAAEGLGPQAIQTRLNAEGLPSPTGRAWVHPTIRQILRSDLYVPYSREELSGMVSEEAMTRLDAEEAGLWWFGRKQTTVTGHSSSEPDENGERLYREHTTTRIRPVEERVGVPVPAPLPRRLVDEARAMLAANRPKALKHEAREWELRGLVRCSCGWKMGTHTARSSGNGKAYSYFTCNNRRQNGKASSCTQRAIPAEGLEGLVWGRVERLLSRPEELIAGLDRMIERERLRTGGDPDEEARRWHRRLQELDEQRGRSQDLAIEGMLDREELRVRLERIEGQRKMAEKELELTRHRGQRVRELEDLKARWADGTPMMFEYVEGADHRSATPEEKRRVYRHHRVEVNIGEDGFPVLTGTFGEQVLCNNETLSSPAS